YSFAEMLASFGNCLSSTSRVFFLVIMVTKMKEKNLSETEAIVLIDLYGLHLLYLPRIVSQCSITVSSGTIPVFRQQLRIVCDDTSAHAFNAFTKATYMV